MYCRESRTTRWISDRESLEADAGLQWSIRYVRYHDDIMHTVQEHWITDDYSTAYLMNPGQKQVYLEDATGIMI